MISTRGRYALRIMIDLAENVGGQRLSLKDISVRQGLSEKYLENIAKLLIKESLIIGVRGRNGGYKLTKKASEYTVLSILELTETSLAPVACLDCPINQCKHSTHCKTLPMWKKLDKIIDDFFLSITLEDLVRQKI